MKRVKVSVERVRGADLQPGDLFSEFGDNWNDPPEDAVAGNVSFRTNRPLTPDLADETVYRLTLTVEEVPAEEPAAVAA